MAVAPIVGRLRKGLIMDLSIALGLGTGMLKPTPPVPVLGWRLTTWIGMGYGFWYGT